MCVFKNQKEKKKRNGREEIFQRAMNENFSKLKKKKPGEIVHAYEC